MFNCLQEAIETLLVSVAFPKLKITDLQILGLVQNNHYEHIALTLRIIDQCIANGWYQPKLLKTRSKFELESFISEVYLVNHLIKSSVSVRSTDNAKKNSRVPDLLITRGDQRMVIEITTPRDWRGLDLFQDELRTGIMNIDLPYDFKCYITNELLIEITEDIRLLNFNPWAFAKSHQNDTKRQNVINTIVVKLSEKLSTHPQSFEHEYIDVEHNIKLTFKIDSINTNKDLEPLRRCEFNQLPIIGYNPDGMFKNLVSRKLKNKLSQKQTSSFDGHNLKALFVNIDMLGYSNEFYDRNYQKDFAQSLSLLNRYNICEDIIVFYNTCKNESCCIQIPAFFLKPGTDINKMHTLINFTFQYRQLATNSFFCEIS
jgi:hypothetical protein